MKEKGIEIEGIRGIGGTIEMKEEEEEGGMMEEGRDREEG